MKNTAPETAGSADTLQRPLYIFALPVELLSSLRLRESQQSNVLVDAPQDNEGHEKAIQRQGEAIEAGTATSCALCGASILDVAEQRKHIRSDIHRYNLKLKLKDLPPVDEPTFNELVGDLDESISGSDSSDSETELDNDGGSLHDSTLRALMKRQLKLGDTSDDMKQMEAKKNLNSNSPILWLSSHVEPEKTCLGVYKTLFTLSEPGQDLVQVIKSKQITPFRSQNSGPVVKGSISSATDRSPSYFLCMTGGGHFAAMVISLTPSIHKGARGVEERRPIVKAHKTFHRYTTRRKQGGSQSANDNAKGNAHSAGSSIRRYNEKALEADIRLLLSDWKQMIDSAELLFIRAAGPSSRRTILGPYENQVINTIDPRVRTFPFSTKRATQSELLRAFTELTRLKVGSVAENIPQEPADASAKNIKPEKPKQAALKDINAPSKEVEALQLHSSQVQALTKRSKAPALLTYLKNNNLSSNFVFSSTTTGFHHTPTLLHFAASLNSAAVVSTLLLQGEADPSPQNGDGKTAFELAGDVKTRDAFRVARYQIGESGADWKAARVSSAISQDEAESRRSQAEAEQQKLEAERRRTDLENLRSQEESQHVGRIERTAGRGQSLVARDKTGAEKREEEGRGLTAEMRGKLERERRARAAEERMKKMQAEK